MCETINKIEQWKRECLEFKSSKTIENRLNKRCYLKNNAVDALKSVKHSTPLNSPAPMII